VSGGLADDDMAKVVADAGVPFVAMHWRGHSRDMQQRAVYQDVVGEVCAELSTSRRFADAECENGGIRPTVERHRTDDESAEQVKFKSPRTQRFL
jgi:dihydropteroate synthase